VLSFLSVDQERYFFTLHRFCSAPGEQVYGPGKLANANKVLGLSQQLQQHFNDPAAAGFSGAEVIALQRQWAWQWL
jgi:hypothetical protein